MDKQHLKIVRTEGNLRGERDALGNLGNAYASLKDFEKAFNYFEKAREISEEMRDYRGIGDVLGNIGKVPRCSEWARGKV
ncbi:MAG: tetratricopeptide repeat protein [Methanothrix sp.]|nr:tetratricopeptide repeat protein [Methanothrix sp.]